MRVVITAGAPLDGAYARAAGTSLKALAPLRGSTMLARTLDVCAELHIDEVAVVGNDAIARACDGRRVRIVPDAGSGAANVRAALAAWPDDDEPLLYLTCDMPFLDARSLRSYLERSPGGALTMALCEYDAFEHRFPGAPPFGITLAGERVVNGGAFVIPPRVRARVADRAMRLFDARKSPWRMAAVAGVPLLLRLAFGTLSIAALEARARDLLGTEVVAVRGCAPELGYDADTAAEYLYACDRI
ncbi:MAG: nucleotidyltransferase family protein [bacterium]|nr:nucleotidyltransferase family protein [bacterium]